MKQNRKNPSKAQESFNKYSNNILITTTPETAQFHETLVLVNTADSNGYECL